MQFEWDEAKDQANQMKHGISFEKAMLIFKGPLLTREDSRLDYGETRYVSIGCLGEAVIVAVVHTNRHGITRIISARLASRNERQDYDNYTQTTGRS